MSVTSRNKSSSPGVSTPVGLNVLKRDGSVQPFDKNKLVSSISNAGASEQQANLVTNRVVNRIGDRQTVSSQELSGMVGRSLSRVNSTASGQYVALQNQKLSTYSIAQLYFKPISMVAVVVNLWKRINFVMQHQEQTNWCWAATAVSVSAFFNPATPWTQCKLVNAEFNRTDCCTYGSSSNCNKPWYLDRALIRTGNYVSGPTPGAGTMTDVKNEISNNRPLCVRIGWSGGGGHAVALDGYSESLGMVAVDDPWYGSSDVSLSVFQTSYQGAGSWTHSYRVKP